MGVDISDIVPSKTIELEHLTGRVLAIDAYNTLYQFLSIIRQPDGSPLKTSSGIITSHLTGLLYRTVRMVEKGIKPCFVFDGVPPEQKHKTILERQKVRETARKKWEEAIKAGAEREAFKYAQQATRLTHEMVNQSKELLDALGIPYVEAPSEGEAQASYMAAKGSVWAVGSQDFDSLLFGAPILVRNLAITGKRKLPKKDIYITVKPELLRLDEALEHLGITREQLVDIGIIIGTDYNEGIKGIGPKKALDLVKKGKTAEEVYEEAGGELPDIPVLRSLFLKPEVVEDYSIKWGKPDEGRLFDLLCGKYEFSKERVEKAIDRLNQHLNIKGTQSRLDQFF
ncbi:MAG: flap endonuclease-1 [Candidatus Diapherotrites archaeon]|nr:flap endonuclease-1 [Candidatus Diapherotrites archaeon]